MRILLGLLVLCSGVVGLSGCGSNSNKAQPTTSTIPDRPTKSPDAGAGGKSKAPPPTESTMAPPD